MTHEHIVEMDAMDVAEWEKDRLTPLAPDAHLAALVKETAPQLPPGPPVARKTATIARAPNPPPTKSGPIPRLTPTAMSAVKPPSAPPSRRTAQLVAAKPPQPVAKTTQAGVPIAPAKTAPVAEAAKTTAKAAPIAEPAAKAKPRQKSPTQRPAQKAAAPQKPTQQATQRAVAQKPASIDDDLAIAVAAPAKPAVQPLRERVAQRAARPQPERVAVAAVHTPVPERSPSLSASGSVYPSAGSPVASEPAHPARPASPSPVPFASLSDSGSLSASASAVDNDWFGENDGTHVATPVYAPRPATEPAPLPPPPMQAAEPISDPVEVVPIHALPLQIETVETQHPEYDWTPRPGTAPGPDQILPAAAEERTRSTDSLPAIPGRRSRRPLVIFASAAIVIAVVAFAALSGGHEAAAPAAVAIASVAKPTPAPAPAVTAPAPAAAIAVAVATPEAMAAVAEPTPPTKPPVVKRLNRARPKKVVLEYDRPSEPAPPSDDVAVAKARASYNSGNQRLFAGDPDGAMHFYRQALADYPGYVAGYRGLGLAFAQQGDKPKALQALRSYVAAVPNAKDVALIKARIARLAK